MGRFTSGSAGSIRSAFSPPGPAGNRPAGDLGQVAGLRAAPCDDGVLDSADPAARPGVLDRLDHRPPKDPGSLLGDGAAGHLQIRLAVPWRQTRPGTQLLRPAEPGDIPDL